MLIAPLVGEHVVAGRPIAYAWRTSLEQPPPDPAALAGPIQDAVVIGYQRTLQQDVRFGMRQLVDIALRALSPADSATRNNSPNSPPTSSRYVTRPPSCWPMARSATASA